ncbi:hypothetical protein V7Y60_25940 [Priestia megaterium]|uniref:hypothetical protein n=1 Tax=Priestia megaterium TaxID=1404 RepID=UPI002FFF230C
MFKIKVKKHLLICTCILGLSATGVLIQSITQSGTTKSNLALNEVVETHITAEQQKQAELTNSDLSILNSSENVQLESEVVEAHITAEQQKQAELNIVKGAMFKGSEDLNSESDSLKIHVMTEEHQKVGQTES